MDILGYILMGVAVIIGIVAAIGNHLGMAGSTVVRLFGTVVVISILIVITGIIHYSAQ